MFKDKEQRTKFIQISLFILTLIATTISGAEWMTGKSLFYGETTITEAELWKGLYFSIPFLLILTVHEFGHYFTAKYHKVKVTLPFYLPVWLGFLPGFQSIGTMGAFIKIKDMIDSRKKYFDIGIAGPLAGFVIALFLLIYAFANLPARESIYEIHPDYEKYGLDYADKIYTYDYNVAQHYEAYQRQRATDSLTYLSENETNGVWGGYPPFEPWPEYTSFSLGSNLLFECLEYILVSDPKNVPNQFEMMHYPLLFAGFLALFFTSLNLLPIGQLDGGHILYGLVGAKNHKWVSRIIFVGLVYYAGLGIIQPFAMSEMLIDELIYFGFVYLCFYKFTPNNRDRIMYALGVIVAQMSTSILIPSAQGYAGWLLFSFLLGRVLGIYHPPVLIDTPLDLNRKILGWITLGIFIISFSPEPFKTEIYYSKEVKSEMPGILSDTKPSPNSVLIDMPNSRPLASNKSINSGEEIKVLDASPEGSKN